MALHTINQQSSPAVAPATYASELAQRVLPRRRLPDAGVSPAAALALVRDELLLDGNSRQNLATFCTIWVSPEVRQLMLGSCSRFSVQFWVRAG